MRGWLIGIAALAMAACDSGAVPPPSEQAELRPPTPVVEANEVELGPDGLTAGSEAFYFAAGQNEVEAALARALGKASDSGTMEECGAGPMAYSAYPGGLTVNFQNGSLVGWFWREAAENISVNGDITIGAPRAEIEALDGFVMFEDSTLGDEFSIGDRLGGFFAEDSLEMMYSGTQCFFR